MADLPVPQHWDVQVPKDVETMWVDIRIQELRSRIVRTKQDIDDLINGKALALQANLRMLEISLTDLENKRNVVK